MPGEGKRPSLEGLTLLYLRSMRRWSQKELATRLGWADPKQVSRYETGENPLRREQLDVCVAALGYPREVVDALLVFGSLIRSESPEEPPSPVALTSEESGAVDRATLAAASIFLDDLWQELRREKRRKKAEAARRNARKLWERMKVATRQERRDLVAVLPEFRSWALAELVCEASVRAAAHRPEEALELANLALFIAGRVPGGESWRSRVEGYCWAHIGNARRVANDFAGADKAFAQAWDLWGDGKSADPDLLPEWLLHAMEASLRRAQHRFPEALELLEKASSFSGVDNCLILLQKEHIFEQIGDISMALEALAKAASLVEASGDVRLVFALHFKTANHLCHLERYQDARESLPQLRELAVRQGNELDFIRVVWLEGRVAAGQGRLEQAVEALEQVRRDFTVRGLPYDAALASLELAVLYLKEDRSPEVRDLARAMTWIFRAQRITREALAALTLFCDAAQRETATVELTQMVIAEFNRVKSSAPLRVPKQRGRG